MQGRMVLLLVKPSGDVQIEKTGSGNDPHMCRFVLPTSKHWQNYIQIKNPIANQQSDSAATNADAITGFMTINEVLVTLLLNAHVVPNANCQPARSTASAPQLWIWTTERPPTINIVNNGQIKNEKRTWAANGTQHTRIPLHHVKNNAQHVQHAENGQAWCQEWHPTCPEYLYTLTTIQLNMASTSRMTLNMARIRLDMTLSHVKHATYNVKSPG